MTTTSTSTINKKYTPPNKKQDKPGGSEPPLKAYSSFTAPATTVKKALKKEFSLIENSEAFPSLSAAYKDKNNQQSKSFANATKTEIIKPQKLVSEVKPGWVHIRKHNREFQFKYGPPSDRNPHPCEISEVRYGEMLVKHRLAKEQYDRERDLERLGDLSEYYGEPTIHELFDEEERKMLKSMDSSESDNDSINNESIMSL